MMSQTRESDLIYNSRKLFPVRVSPRICFTFDKDYKYFKLKYGT